MRPPSVSAKPGRNHKGCKYEVSVVLPNVKARVAAVETTALLKTKVVGVPVYKPPSYTVEMLEIAVPDKATDMEA